MQQQSGSETLQEKMTRLKQEQEQRRVQASVPKEGYEAVESIAEKMRRLKLEAGVANSSSNVAAEVSPRQAKAGYEAVESLAEKMARLRQDQATAQQRSPRGETKAGYEPVESLQEKMGRLKQDQESTSQRSPRGETKAGYEAMESVAEKMQRLKESSASAIPAVSKQSGFVSLETVEEKTRRLKMQQEPTAIPKGAIQVGAAETLAEKLVRLKREQAAAAAVGSPKEDSENRKDVASLDGTGSVSKLSQSMQQKADESAVASRSTVRDVLPPAAESLADKLKRLKAEQQQYQQQQQKSSDGVEVKESVAEKLARLKSEAASASTAASGANHESVADKLARLKREQAAARTSGAPSSPVAAPADAGAVSSASPRTGKETLQEKLERMKREQADASKSSVAEKLALMRSSGVASSSVTTSEPAVVVSSPVSVSSVPAASVSVGDEDYEYEEVSEEDESDAEGDAKVVPVKSTSSSQVVIADNVASAHDRAIEYKRWVDEIRAATLEMDYDKVIARSAEMCALVKSVNQDSSVRLNMDDLHEGLVTLLQQRKAAGLAEADERRRKRDAIMKSMEDSKLHAEQARRKRALRSTLLQKSQLVMQWIVNTTPELKKLRAAFPSPTEGTAAFSKAQVDLDESMRRLKASLKEVEQEVDEARKLYDSAPSGDFEAEKGSALVSEQQAQAEDLLVQHERHFAMLQRTAVAGEFASEVEALSKWSASMYVREDLFDEAQCTSVMQELENKISSLEEAKKKLIEVVGLEEAEKAAVLDADSHRLAMKKFLAEKLEFAESKKLKESTEKTEAEALCAAFVAWLATAAGSKPEASTSEELAEALSVHEARVKSVSAEGKEKIAACREALARARAVGESKLAFTVDGLESRLVELMSLLKRRTSSLQRMLDEAVEREESERKLQESTRAAHQAWDAEFGAFQRWIEAEQSRVMASTAEDETENVMRSLNERLAAVQTVWDELRKGGMPGSNDRAVMDDVRAGGKRLEGLLAERDARLATQFAVRKFSALARLFMAECEENLAMVATGQSRGDDVASKCEADFDKLKHAWDELVERGHAKNESLKDVEDAKANLLLACSLQSANQKVAALHAYEASAAEAIQRLSATLEALKGPFSIEGDLDVWLAELNGSVEAEVKRVDELEQQTLSAWVMAEEDQATANPPFRVVQELVIEARDAARRRLAQAEAAVQVEKRSAVSASFAQQAQEFLDWITVKVAAVEAFHDFGDSFADVDRCIAETLPALDQEVLDECASKRRRIDDEWERVRLAGVLGTPEEPKLKHHDCSEASNQLEHALRNRLLAAKVARSEKSSVQSEAPVPPVISLVADDAVLDVVLKERQLEREEKRTRRASLRMVSSPLGPVVAHSGLSVVSEEVVGDSSAVVPSAAAVDVVVRDDGPEVAPAAAVADDGVEKKEGGEEEEEEVVIEEEIVEEDDAEPLANFVAGEVQFEDADLLDVFANIELDDLLKSIRHAAPVRSYFTLPAVQRKMLQYLLSQGDLTQNLLDDFDLPEDEMKTKAPSSGDNLPHVPSVVPGLAPPDLDELAALGKAGSVLSGHGDSEVVVAQDGSVGLTLQRTKLIILELFMNTLSAVMSEALCATEESLEMLMRHWLKEPLIELIEDRYTLDLVSKLTQHLIATHSREFFRYLLNSPTVKVKLMDLFHVKEASEVLRAMLEKEPEMERSGFPELQWSKGAFMPFLLKKLQRGVDERLDVTVVETCDYMSQLLLTCYRSKPHFVSEFMESLPVVTNAMLDPEHPYQPELFSLFFSLVPNSQEIFEQTSFSADSENEYLNQHQQQQQQQQPQQQQVSPQVVYPKPILEFLCSSGLSNSLKSILVEKLPAGMLGGQRWKAAQVVCCMVGTLHPEVIDVLISSGNLALVLDLFLELPRCSMLHCMMLDAIRYILHHSARLRQWLLVVYRFVEKSGGVYEKMFDKSELPRMPHAETHNLGHLYDAMSEVSALKEEMSREEIDSTEVWSGAAEFQATLQAIEQVLSASSQEGGSSSHGKNTDGEENLDDDTEQMLAAALAEEMSEDADEVVVKDVEPVVQKKGFGLVEPANLLARKKSQEDEFADAVLAAAVAADMALNETEADPVVPSLLSEQSLDEATTSSSGSGSGTRRSWTARRHNARDVAATTEGASGEESASFSGSATGGEIAIPVPSSSRRSWKGKHAGPMKELSARYRFQEPKHLSDSMDAIGLQLSKPLGEFGSSPMPVSLRSVQAKKPSAAEEEEADAILAAAVAAEANGSGGSAEEDEATDSDAVVVLGGRKSQPDSEIDDETAAILAAAAADDSNRHEQEGEEDEDDETAAILAAAAAEDHGSSKTENVDEETEAIFAAAVADDHAPKSGDAKEPALVRSGSGGSGVRRSWREKARLSGSMDEVKQRYTQKPEDPVVSLVPVVAEPESKTHSAGALPRRSWKEKALSRNSGSLEDLASRYKNLGGEEQQEQQQQEDKKSGSSSPAEGSPMRRSFAMRNNSGGVASTNNSSPPPPVTEESLRRSWRNQVKPVRSQSRSSFDDSEVDAVFAAAVAEDKAAQQKLEAEEEVVAETKEETKEEKKEEIVPVSPRKIVSPRPVFVEVKPLVLLVKQKEDRTAELRQKYSELQASIEAERQHIVELQREAQMRSSEVSRLEEAKRVADQSDLLRRELLDLKRSIGEHVVLVEEAARELQHVESSVESEERLMVARDRLAASVQDERRKNSKISADIMALAEKRVGLERELAVQRSAAEAALVARASTAGRDWEEDEREVKRLRNELRDVEAAIETARAKEPKLRAVMEQEMATNQKDLEEMVQDYTIEIEKLKERARVVHAMKILQQKREAGAGSSSPSSSSIDSEGPGVQCTSCQTVVKKKGAKFCSKCRTPLPALPEVPQPALVVAPVVHSPQEDDDDGEGSGKKKVVGRRASVNMSEKTTTKSGSQRKKDPRRAPVTMQSIKGLLAAHEPCLMCQWYNSVAATVCVKCGAKLKE